MRTRVFITIDTEFSIGGAFESPDDHAPIGAQNVLCTVDGVSEGLGFMLNTFRAHGIRATFFVEAMQTAFFGDAPMGELTKRIADAGHDVQLHLHPVWTYFDHADWRRQLATERPADDFHGRSIDQLTTWMRRGIAVFERWRVPPPVALRTGNLMVDRNVYRAMSQVGMKVASNIARALFDPEDPALRFNGGVRRIEGIVELPVMTYGGLKLGRRRQLKSLTIAGSSIDEIVHVLERAHDQRCSSAVVLTHCHEFVKGDMNGKLKVNRLNQSRLVALCRFLRDQSDRFEPATMAEMATAPAATHVESDALLEVPARLAVRRIVQNTLSDRT